jgi:hypothetical protein
MSETMLKFSLQTTMKISNIIADRPGHDSMVKVMVFPSGEIKLQYGLIDRCREEVFVIER